MPSNDAMMDLYNNGVSISQISKVLSVGMIGRKSARKLVPTKWSISATDQTISANLIRIIQANAMKCIIIGWYASTVRLTNNSVDL